MKWGPFIAVPLLFGCTGTDPAPAPPSGLAPAKAYLDTASYDCSATGPFEPPPRKHAQGCFADSSCSARLVTAHRIATPFAPENSLSALRAAILLGVDIVETDVRLTADGAVVLLHDGSVDRTLQGSGDVDALSLAELQAMPMKSGDKPGDFSCDRVPTLDEVFALARGRVVVELEVKDSDAGVQAARYLRDNDLYGDAFMLCGPAECAALRAEVPDVPIMSRPESASEVTAETSYDPPPELVHIDPFDDFLTAEVLETIHGVNAKAFANAFLDADVAAIGSGDLNGYAAMYDRGLDVVQTEFPHWALQGLGRLSRP